MGNIYGYGAQQQIPNKDKSFSLGAASLRPHPFLQLVCVTLGRLIAKCCVLPAEDVTQSTVGCFVCSEFEGKLLSRLKKKKRKKKKKKRDFTEAERLKGNKRSHGAAGILSVDFIMPHLRLNPLRLHDLMT